MAADGLQIAYRYLNRRERTVAEMRARLQKAEIAEVELDAVVGELLEFGYLDDARYARVFVQDRRTLDAWGDERIVRTLRERGVDGDVIVAALGEEDAAAEGGGWPGAGAGNHDQDGSGDGQRRRAVALLRQRFPAGPADRRDRERAFGVLARKGYDSETAQRP